MQPLDMADHSGLLLGAASAVIVALLAAYPVVFVFGLGAQGARDNKWIVSALRFIAFLAISAFLVAFMATVITVRLKSGEAVLHGSAARLAFTLLCAALLVFCNVRTKVTLFPPLYWEHDEGAARQSRESATGSMALPTGDDLITRRMDEFGWPLPYRVTFHQKSGVMDIRRANYILLGIDIAFCLLLEFQILVL